MKIIKIKLDEDNDGAINEAVKVLKNGGAIVYPTDTVYGLGVNACDFNSVDQIFKIKKRPYDKGLPVLVRNMNWAREIVFIPPKLEAILSQIWPGKVTVLLPKKKSIPSITSGGNKNLAIRISDLKLIDRILRKFGYPITATSANISGDDSCRDASKIARIFGENIWKPDLILDAGILVESKPSTILDLSTIKPKVLRTGDVGSDQLLNLFKSR